MEDIIFLLINTNELGWYHNSKWVILQKTLIFISQTSFKWELIKYEIIF